MKLYSLIVLLFSGYALCNLVNNVHLVGHTSYAIDVLTKTVNIVEETVRWSNLRLPDYVFQLNDTILGSPIRGTIVYSQGFLASIQHLDIRQDTVQQVWRVNASAESTHTVTVQATLRMHDVAVGFNVAGHLQSDNELYWYTALFVHPLVSFNFAIIKDLFTGAITVTVVGNVPTVGANSPLAAEFRPQDSTSDIFRQTFNANAATSAGIAAWGPEIFQPITYQLVTEEIEFPAFCYNCPLTRS